MKSVLAVLALTVASVYGQSRAAGQLLTCPSADTFGSPFCTGDASGSTLRCWYSTTNRASGCTVNNVATPWYCDYNGNTGMLTDGSNDVDVDNNNATYCQPTLTPKTQRARRSPEPAAPVPVELLERTYEALRIKSRGVQYSESASSGFHKAKRH